MSTITDFNNVSVFTPEGKIIPLENIKKTVELGNTTLGLTNDRIGVLVAYLGSSSDYSYPTKKLFKINKRSIFTYAGITNDGLEIVDYLLEKGITEEVIKDRDIHFLRVFDDLCYEASFRTLVARDRLYGAGGLLLTDYNGAKLVEFQPAGCVKEARAMAIGNRAQSARTILENEVENLDTMGVDEMCRVGIRALKNSHPEEGALTKDNVEIWCLEAGKEYYKIDVSIYL
ncbi:putative proteasome subunit alpha type-6 [Astathelohania contejeani]|uniref:Proteasome subunit alpha type-6 n=1 Tax=Astathelohania contejeani TaxID=164912 RepID=A0ABQ7HVY7_9MICR|nr:putative proteasome subunit alpha type-6 [Thelohania contejeani]